MLKLNTITIVALILVIVGALNWGLVGIFGFDLVAAIFGEMTFLARLVYALVGIAAVTLLFELSMTIQHEYREHHPAHPV